MNFYSNMQYLKKDTIQVNIFKEFVAAYQNQLFLLLINE